MTANEKYMKLALEQARNSTPEDSQPRPKVGVVVVKNGKLLTKAFRGELKSGDHAEYTALEKKLKGKSLNGAVVFTTLEPCTERSKGKVPCTARLIERRVSKVFIGMVDPNPKISGKGIRKLRAANIDTQMFSREIAAEVERLNREFIQVHDTQDSAILFDESLFETFYKKNRTRSLDDWYKTLNRIYWDRNSERDVFAIFTHLVEVVGSVSVLASGKKRNGFDPETYIVKAIAWWLAMCGKLGIRSVETLIWDKFPGACPYCQRRKHDHDACIARRARYPNPEWNKLAKIGIKTSSPKRLGDWQLMFSDIYPVLQKEGYGTSFARLSEELGEIAEAIRVFPREPGYFLSEAADVFAWLMHILNILDIKRKTPTRKRGDSLERIFCSEFPDICKHCKQKICVCSPILAVTIGRFAHESLRSRAGYGYGGRFLTPDQIFDTFSFE